MIVKWRPSSVRRMLCGSSPDLTNHFGSIARATAASAAAASRPIDWAIGATIRYCIGRAPVTRASSTHSARARVKAWDAPASTIYCACLGFHCLARFHPAPAGLGEAHRVQAAGNDEPISLNRVGDAGRIDLDRAQVAE